MVSATSEHLLLQYIQANSVDQRHLIAKVKLNMSSQPYFAVTSQGIIVRRYHTKNLYF